MSTPNLEYIPNNTLFFSKLVSINSELDLNTTLTMSRFSFADTQGKEYCNYCITDFIKSYNQRFGNTMNPNSSMTAGKNSWLVEFYENIEVKPSIKPEKEEKYNVEQEESEIPISLETKEEVVTENEELVAEATTNVDWDYVHGLKNTKADKKALDEYAETFGVKLNRVKKIDNMVSDFKEFIESK